MSERIRSYHDMNRRVVAMGLAVLVLSCLLPPGAGCGIATKEPYTGRVIALDTPFKVLAIRVPSFPQRSFDIRDYGAAGDGNAMNTKAFAAAIAACAQAGGGRVLVPAGTWLTGPIHLKSNINLHLEKDAGIRFSANFEDYLPVVFTRYEGLECYNYSPLIYARDCTNVAVSGEGKLDGQGKPWWQAREKYKSGAQRLYNMASGAVPVKDRVFGTTDYFLRPSFIQFVNCKNVLVEGLTVGSGPMWIIHPVYCENVIVRNVTLINNGPNNDGIDPDSCRNVLIEYCNFDTNDDAVAIKSGRDADGWRVGRPCENIIVRHCRFGLGSHCDGVVSIGSEMSGDVRNVFIHDCTFDRTERAVRIKSKRGRGGVVENIWLEDITIGEIDSDPLLLNMFYGSGVSSSSKATPKFRNIYVKNLTCRKARNAIRIVGLPESSVENVRLENISISSENGLSCTDAKGIKLINVNIAPKKGPVIRFKNSRDVIIEKSTCAKGTDTFLELEGERTTNIHLIDNDLSNAQRAIVFGRGVRPDVVRCK